jgi:glyoxylase-like metal-dependent hydrolase (beta-lactamase superfamily II)
MKLIHLCPESWGANCYLLISGNEAFTVDPSPSADAVIKRLTEENARLMGILLTHGHFDHVISAEMLHSKTGAPVMIHEADNEMLPDPEKNAFRTFFGKDRSFRQADRLLRDGEILTLGGEEIEVIHTPGHTKGCICLKAGNILLTGDTLFADSFGRIDLFGGSLSDMKHSLLRLKSLDPGLSIYPGHGEKALLGEALSKIRFLNR